MVSCDPHHQVSIHMHFSEMNTMVELGEASF